MTFLPNQLELQKIFSGFLFETGLSAVSVKNYLSDLRHFFSFCTEVSAQDTPPTVQEIFQNISKYLNLYLTDQKKSFTPQNTINRRLASIRRFSTFLSVKYGLDSGVNSLLKSNTTSLLSKNDSNNSEDDSLPTIARILEQFKSFLLKEKKSYSTIKNYISDLNHFFAWSANETPFLDQNLENILSLSHLNTYVSYLKLSHTSTSVINRRQSSIKQFTRYSFLQKYIPSNPFEYKIETPRLLPLSWLERLSSSKHKASKSNSRSLLGVWYQKYHSLPFTPYLHLAVLVLATSAMVIFGYNQIIKEALPSSAALPTVPRRQLSFQGRLTDSSNTPITTLVDVDFKLWNHPTAGSQLYSTGTCTVDPDPNGIFNSIIGASGCGSEIDATVFTENRDVYLEIAIGAETLTPRQQIATVGYALNSETLQGYPASAAATINTVPIVDDNGDINISVNSPTINSTSGTFTVTGQALSLTTAANSGGDIILQPDSLGGGQVQVLGSTTNTDTLRIENSNLTSGALISGYIGNNTATGRLLSLTSGSTETDRFYVGANGQVKINTASSLANSGLIIDQNGTGDIFTASASGNTKFTIANNGNITALGILSGLTGLTVSSGTVSLPNGEINNAEISELDWTKLQNYPSSCPAGQAIQAVGDTLTCVSISALAGNLWQQNLGTLSPLEITNALNLGATGTSSATVSLPGTTNSDAFFNLGTGNLGIGTTTPSGRLDITGSSDDQQLIVRANSAQTINIAEIYNSSSQLVTYLGADGSFYTRSGGDTYGRIGLLTTGVLEFGPGNAARDVNLYRNSANVLRTNDTLIVDSYLGVATTTTTEVLSVSGDAYIAGTKSHVDTTNLSVTDSNLRVVNTYTASDLDEKGAVLTFEDYYFNGGVPQNITTRAAIKGGTDTTGNTANGYLAFYTDSGSGNSSSEKMRINYLGNVGIGTTTPTALLDIAGDASTSGSLVFRGTNPSTIDILNGNRLDFQTSPGGDANLAAKMTLTSSGYLGIGLTNPTANLHIANTGVAQILIDADTDNSVETDTPSILMRMDGHTNALKIGVEGNAGVEFTNSIANTPYINSINNYALQLATNSIARMIINSSGKVGIGLTNPTYDLDVTGDINLTGALRDNGDAGSSGQVLTSTGTGLAWLDPALLSSNYWQRNSGALTPLEITNALNLGATATASAIVSLPGTTNQNAFFNLGTGNVGIGTTSPDSKLSIKSLSTAQFHLTGSATDLSGLYISNIDEGNNGNEGVFSLGADFSYSGGSISSWTARSTSAGAIHVDNGSFNFYSNTGLTYGNTFTPTSRMTITETGNVGINTTAPTALLDIAGNASSSGILTFRGTADPKIRILNGEDLTFQTSPGGDTGLLDRVTILNNGNVGIGTTVPPTRLSVDNTISVLKSGTTTQVISLSRPSDYGLISINDNTGTTKVSLNANGVSYFDSGNVGIGTTIPDADLDIYDSTTLADAILWSQRIGSDGTGGTDIGGGYGIKFQHDIDGGTGNKWAGIASVSESTYSNTIGLAFYTGSVSSVTEKLRITNDGKVGIGTTTPTALLDIAGDASTSGSLVFRGTNPSTIDILNGNRLDFLTSPGGDANLAAKMTLTSSGYLGIGDTTPAATLTVGSGDLFQVAGATGNITTLGDAYFQTAQITVGSEANFVPTTEQAWILASSAANRTLRLLTNNDGTIKSEIELENNNAVTGTIALKTANDGTDASTRLFIDGAGNIGIGTTTPTALLDIAGSASTSGTLAFRGTTDPKLDILNGESFGIRFSPGGDAGLVERFALNNAGAITTGTWNASLIGLTYGGTNKNMTPINGGIVWTDADSMEVTAAGTSGQVLISNGAAAPSWSAMSAVNYWQRNAGALTPLEITNALNLGATATASAIVSLPGTTNQNAFFNLGTGNVGIGTTTPTAKLYIQSSTGNLLTINDTVSDIVNITSAQTTFNNPTSFTSSGDVSIAYDLNFTNPTSSYIKSASPLIFQAGETFNSSDLTLKTFNKGNVVVDSEALYTTGAATISGQLTANNNLQVNGYATTSGSLAVGYTNALSGPGHAIFAGNVGIGLTNPASRLSITQTGTTTADGINIVSGGYIGTINMDSYGQLLIGNTLGTDGHIAFTGTEVQLSGTTLLNLNTTAGSRINDNAPTRFGSDSDFSIIYSSTANALQFTTGYTADTNVKMVLDSAGNLGIGLTNPTYDLDVTGDINLTGALRDNGDAGSSGQVLTSTGTGLAWLDPALLSSNYWQRNSGVVTPLQITNALNLGATATASAIVSLPGTTNQNAFFNLGTGNVGIGLTNPSSKLEVVGNITATSGYLANALNSSLGNMIRNGSAENGTTYWVAGNGSGSDGAVSAYSTDSFIGTNSLRYVRTTLGTYAIWYNTLSTYLPTPYFDTDKTYTLSYYAKSLSGTPTLSSSIKDSGATNIVTSCANTVLSSSWQQVTCTFTPAVTGTTPVLYFSSSATPAVDILIDSVMLTTGSQAYGYAALQTDKNDNAYLNNSLTTAGSLAVNGDSITADGATLTINAAGNVDVQDILNADSITTDTAGVTIAASQSYSGLGAVTYRSANASALTINSGTTGAINLGTDASDEVISIGTGTANKTFTIGSVTGGSVVYIQAGTSGLNIGDDAIGKTIDIGGNDYDAANTIRIATGATNADTISIGNTNAATTIALTGGDDWSISATGNIITNGIVGIGLTNPTYDLDVTGDINLTGALRDNGGAGTSGQILSSTGTGVEWIDNEVGTQYWQRNAGALTPLEITNALTLGATATASAIVSLPGTTNSDAFFNLGTGNVGISTTAPTAKLHIKGTSDDQQLAIQANSSQTTNLQEWQNSSGTVISSVNSIGSFGVGADAISTSRLRVYWNNVNPSSYVNGISNTLYISANAADNTEQNSGFSNVLYTQGSYNFTNPQIGFLPSSYHNGTGNVSTLEGGRISIGNLSTGTISSLYGIRNFVYSPGAGAITDLYGIESSYYAATVTGNMYGVRVATNTGAAGTNKYGLSIGSVSGASTGNYSIYTNAGNVALNAGGDASSFVGIGLTNPTDTLVVSKTVGADIGETRFGGSNGRTLSAYNNGSLSNFDFYALSTYFNSDILLGTGKKISTANSSNANLYLTANGTGIVYTDKSFGIGLTNPTYDLDVAGDINLTGALRSNGDAGTSSQILSSTGTGVEWVDASTAGSNYWQRNAGALTPLEITNALTLGATATASAIVSLPGTTNQNAFFNLGTGNVGIGTTNPQANLQIASTFSKLVLNNTVLNSTDSSAIDFLEDANQFGASSGYGFRTKLDGLNNLFLIQSGNQTTVESRLAIMRDSGNVGIGTTAPEARLTVGGTGTPTFVVEASDGSNWFDVGSGGAGVVRFNTAGGITQVAGIGDLGARMNIGSLTTSRIPLALSGVSGQTADLFNIDLNGSGGNQFTIEASGEVGIGTSNPATLLEVAGGADATETKLLTIRSNYTSTNTASTLRFANTTVSTANNGAGEISVIRNASNASSMIFRTTDIYTALDERMRIDGSGNVGIGLTNPTYDLDVAGDINLTGALRDNGNAGTSGQILSSTGTGVEWIDNEGGAQYWQWNGGVLSPTDLNDSITLGTTATSSATVHLAGKAGYNSFINTGNFGIGTTEPDAKLTINQGTYAAAPTTGTTPVGGFRLAALTGGLAVLDAGVNGASGAWIQATLRSDLSQELPLQLNPNGGNVGIGTTAPGARLEILSSSGSDTPGTNLIQALTASTTQGFGYRYNASASVLNLDRLYGGSWFQTMAFDRTNGFVGIGTTAPTQKFDVGNIFVVDTTNTRVGIGLTNPSSTLEIAGASSTISNTSGDITFNSASGFFDFSGDSFNNFLNATASGQIVLGNFADAGRPVPIGAGSLIYSTTQGNPQYHNGTTWQDITNYFGRTSAGVLYPIREAFDSINLGTTNGATASAKVRLSGDIANNTFFLNPVAVGFTTAMTSNVMLQVKGNIYPSDTVGGYDLGGSANPWGSLTLNDGIYYGSTQRISIASNRLADGNWYVATGGLKINTSSAFTASELANNIKLYVAGNATVSGSFSTGADLTVNEGNGKINVGTIDPPFTINGDKYATYVASMIGIKEEVVGKVSTSENNYIEGLGFRTLIDLDQQPVGSDIWLFSHTTNIQTHINDLSVLLTPEGQAKAWYEVDRENKILAIYSSTPTNITYRLTAPRFDSDKWKNTRNDPKDPIGFVINDPNVYSNTDSIFDNPTISPELIAQIDGTYTLKINGVENKEVSSFMTGIIANLKAGSAVIANLVTDNLTVRTKLISPIADIDQLKVIDANVTGTLYADNIKGKTVDNLNIQIDLLNEKYSTASSILADLQAKYSTYDQLISSTSDNTEIISDPLTLSPYATTSAIIPSDLALNSLNVETIITSDLLANGSIFTNSLSSFENDLFIQPAGDKPIHLLANLMTLYPDGKVLINGDLLITGTLYAQAIDTQIASVSGTLAVGSSTIASESARFAQLTTDGLIIASGNTAQATISGQTNTNATIGTATIFAGSNEISITNSKVSPTTLIYVTPTSDTFGRVLFVKSKVENLGFTVGVTGESNTPDISFNYWLVETK